MTYPPNPQYPGQPPHPGQPPEWQQPYPGQPYPGQQPPYPGQQPPHPGQPPYPGQQPWPSQPPKKKSKTGWIIGALVLLLVLCLVGVGAYFFLNNDNGQTSGGASSSSSLSSSASSPSSSSSATKTTPTTSSPPSGPYTIEYKLTVDGSFDPDGYIDVSWYESVSGTQDQIRRATDNDFPLDKTLTVDAPDQHNWSVFFTITFYPKLGHRPSSDDPRTVSCEILVNGKSVSTGTSSLGDGDALRKLCMKKEHSDF